MSSNNRRIQRVPALLIAEEEDEMKKNDYYPKVASIGPYHYGKPELAQVEAFKPFAVDVLFGWDEDYYYQEVLAMIGQVRNCYEKESVDKFSDADLAQMMLRDASLIIIEMEIYLVHEEHKEMEIDLEHKEIYLKTKAMIDRLGRLTGAVLFRDFILVENQIPLCVIQQLLKLVAKRQEMINDYVNKCIFGEIRPIVESSRVPLHLLEFMHIILVYDRVLPQESNLTEASNWSIEEISSSAYQLGPPNWSPIEGEASMGWASNHTLTLGPPQHAIETSNKAKKVSKKANKAKKVPNWAKKVTHSFRKVMELKARGIHFRPSDTQSLLDVKFESGFFYATLQLPEMFLSHYSKPFIKNLVAYELLPGVETEPTVTSYINLMQLLVERPEDLEELREKKIVYNQLGSDEEALNVFKDINTHGASNDRLFFKVREEIQAHYNSRIKTWIAELIHTHFRSPWTFTAFLAAAAIIALTAAQLYYGVHPVADKTPTSS